MSPGSSPAGAVVWITGLPASGKSTLAARLCARLPAVLLDGDEVRTVLGMTAHDPAARDDFYARLAALAALLARQGLVVVVPATAHRRAHRAHARALAPRFIEVHVRTPLAEAERRDPKGLYARARAGAAPELPGVGVSYEPPLEPEIVADGGLDERALVAIIAAVAGDGRRETEDGRE
jgi:adenylylsulfate kinase